MWFLILLCMCPHTALVHHRHPLFLFPPLQSDGALRVDVSACAFVLVKQVKLVYWHRVFRRLFNVKDDKQTADLWFAVFFHRHLFIYLICLCICICICMNVCMYMYMYILSWSRDQGVATARRAQGQVHIAITNVHSIQKDCTAQNWGEEDTEDDRYDGFTLKKIRDSRTDETPRPHSSTRLFLALVVQCKEVSSVTETPRNPF
jgi:hypothetical protein